MATKSMIVIEVFTIYKTKLGGNGEVHHDHHNGSIVITSTSHNEVAIQKLVLKFESSTTKIMREDKFCSLRVFHNI